MNESITNETARLAAAEATSDAPEKRHPLPRTALALLGSRWTPLAAALLAVVVQLTGLTSDFTYDDRLIIQGNSRFASWSALGRCFTTDYFGSDPGIATAYRPLTLLSFGVEVRLHGEKPALLRAVNLCLHGGVVLLLAGLGRRLFRGAAGEATVGAAALVFAVHPSHVEAVTSLVGRAEGLAAAGTLGALAILAPLLSRSGGFADPKRLLLGGFVWSLGFLSKENAVVLPGLLVLEAHFGAESESSGRERIRRAFLISLCFLPFLGLVMAARRVVLGGWLKGAWARVWRLDNPLVDFDGWSRAAHALRVLVEESMRASVIGWPLKSDLSYGAVDFSMPPGSFAFARGAVVVGLLLVVAYLGAARRHPVSFGILFFLIAISPTSNIFFTAGTVFAERLLYLPSLGAAIVIGVVTARLLDGRSRLVSIAAAGLFPLALGLWAGLSLVRSKVWKSDAVLYRNQVEESPGSARAHYNIAISRFGAGLYQEAQDDFLAAARILPEYYTAWDAAARSAWRRGELELAETWFEESIRWHWKHERAYDGLVDVLQARGENEQALAAARRGVAALPDSILLLAKRADLERDAGSKLLALEAALAVVKLTSAREDDRLRVLTILGEMEEAGEAPPRSKWRWARFINGIDSANRTALESYLLEEDDERARRRAIERFVDAGGADSTTSESSPTLEMLKRRLAAKTAETSNETAETEGSK